MLVSTLIAASALVAAGTVSAGSWPYGKVQFTVPFAKGGGSASIAELANPFIPNSKLVYNAANSGADAWSKMRNDPIDGSVITLINLPHIWLQPVALPGANYSSDDIVISYLNSYTPLVLLVSANSTIKDWADFVTFCGTNTCTVSGAGAGTVFELGTKRLSQLARLPLSYESAGSGANTAISAVLAGNYTAAWTTTPVVFNRPDLRVLAIASEFEFPQIIAPTFKELGINYVDGIYRGVGLPKGTPESVLRDVSDRFNAINRDMNFIPLVQASGAVEIFMGYGSASLAAFTSTYRNQVMSAMYPVPPISQGSLYAMMFLGALGLLLTLLAFVFAAIYRTTPIIKGSSWFFNNITLLGIALMYTSVIVLSVQEPLKGVTQRTITLACGALPWVLGVGFDITFSAIIVKCYRLYRLFLFSTSSVIQFDASNLAILKWVLAICGSNAVVYAVWTAQDPLTATLTSLDHDQTFYYSCSSTHAPAYLGVILAGKYAMLLVCIFFSVKLRELNAVMNESKAIAFATFSTSFILTVCLGVYSMVGNFQGRFIVASGGVWIATTCLLLALFLPKLSIVVLSPEYNTFDYVKKLLKTSGTRGGMSSDEKSSRNHRSNNNVGSTHGNTLGGLSSGANLGSLGNIGSIGSMGSLGAISPVTSPKPRRTSMDPNAPVVGPPIYVPEGKPLAREHRDRISALTRVIVNTAAAGRIGDFHSHVARLSSFAARIKLMNAIKGRAMSSPDTAAIPTKTRAIEEEEDV
ncbi:hypothetical protein HDU86_005840 [Geranomyces michiganensis]|nr:hypothetical protein HDU86_005840 [Geranomyces michiganensis]